MTSGDLAPLYLFYNGPAANPFNSGRFGFYGVTGTPTVKIDGLAASAAPSAYASTINNRLSVPSYIDIEVNMVGDASGGTAYISVTAEQEPSQSYPIKVWCAITEDHEIASSAWGGYTGMEMMYIPVAYPLGSQGQVLNFTGPYPQTLSVAGDYTLNPSAHVFNYLNVSTFVQYASGSRECLNADYMDLPDTATGVYGDETGYSPVSVLTAGPNPTTGAVTIESLLPSDVTGTVQIFDITGRVVESFQAGGTIHTDLRESGVYFVHLSTSSGELVRRQLTVIR